jgi:hypothetical protein
MWRIFGRSTPSQDLADSPTIHEPQLANIVFQPARRMNGVAAVAK